MHQNRARIAFVLTAVHVCVCVHTVRQNRKERLMQKKWSHIDPQLFGPLDEKEVSLKVNQELILHEMLN